MNRFSMLKNMKPGVNPLSPDNILIFATSVIIGTPAPAIPRYTVCAKSPLTGAEGESEAGGWFGPELKKAGFDAIVIYGKAASPVYIYIKDGRVELKDASGIWGKDTGFAEDAIKDEIGDKNIRIAQIGIARENLVRYACIVNELKDFNGRNGLGAVMGSKNLKIRYKKGCQNSK